MTLLSRLRLRTKLALLPLLAGVAIAVIAFIGTTTLHDRMVFDRTEKLRAVVGATTAVARGLEEQVAAHQLTRDQAIEQFRHDVHAIRFDDGVGYIAVLDGSTGVTLIHGVTPSLEGKALTADVATGVPIGTILLSAVQASDEGLASYMFPKPGQTEPLRKQVAVAKFTPWNIVLIAGAYTDDLDAEFHASLYRMGAIGGSILLLTAVLAWLVSRDITGSLGRLQAAMIRLAKGELGTEISGTDRRDEVGAMAGAVLVFKEQMVRAEQLAAEQESERARAEAAKRAALVGMAETVETETAVSLRQIGERTAAMAATSDELSASAGRTGGSAESATGAAAQALANAETVASAAEQLTASIREIGGQVGQSASVVGRAVEAGRETRTTIEALNTEVERIGAVADMIGEIAAKTNLLALNATIEAARAGDAGKGFAVVASEVKQLATQTARSTEEIGRHIAQVRAATVASVAAVSRIEETITEVNAIAGSIAAAVEEQGAATAEIARNVTQTATAANEMTIRIREVAEEATETDRHATAVRENTSALNAAVEELRHSVIRVVRTSSAEVDRRSAPRHALDLPCRVSIAGHATQTARVADMSEGGACLSGAPAASEGARGTLSLDSVATPIGFLVRRAEHGLLRLRFDADAQTASAVQSILQRHGQRRAA
jgi:methyl-accepting chemotaxis protein